MRRIAAAALGLLGLGLAACDPHAADSPGPLQPPADAPAGLTPAAFDGEFQLVGTEPFWGVAIKGGRLVLDRPGEKDVSAARPAPIIEGTGAVWQSGPLTVRLTPSDCSDGMSERSYAYAATVIVDGVTLSGCGDRREVLAAQPN